MPVTAAPQSVWQVRVNWLLEGQQCKNVIHFQQNGSSGDDDVETHLIQVLLNCIITTLLPGLSNSLTLQSVTWKQVGPTLGPEFETLAPGGSVGANITTALPTFCAGLLSIHTQRGGRSGRGRMYVPGIVASADNQDFIDTAEDAWAALAAFAACLLSEFLVGDPPGTTDWSIGTYSRKIGGSSFPYGASGFAEATTIAPQQAIATQRSRKFGRGN